MTHVQRVSRWLAQRPLRLGAAGVMAAGWCGIQLGPGPLAREMSGASTWSYAIARPVGVAAYASQTFLENLTGSPMTIVSVAPTDRPPHVSLHVVLLPNTLATRGGHAHWPPARPRLPAVIPPGAQNKYLVGVARTLHRPEDAVVWGILVQYWWRGTRYTDYIKSEYVDCARQGPTCNRLGGAMSPPAWPPPHPLPSAIALGTASP